MVDYNRVIAGCFAGSGSLLLIYKDYITEGAIILMGLLAFFVGEANQKRRAND